MSRLLASQVSPKYKIIVFHFSNTTKVQGGIGVALLLVEAGGRMSTKGVYTALSGAIAQGQRLDTIANNIANVNTPSFKKDQQVFREYLTAYEKPSDVIQVPKVPASIESFYDNQGADRGYVDGSGTYTDFSQGTLKPTGNKLDLALEGDAFYEVLTPQGVRYTRNGSFAIDAEGRLVTKGGHPVLKKGTEDASSRTITVTNPNFTVSSNGDLYVEGNSLAGLSIVNIGQKEALLKTGNSLYSLKETFDAKISPNVEGKVHQGFIENSNVNVIQEMTDMIAATRAFDSTQRAIKAYDQMDEQVNTIPKF